MCSLHYKLSRLKCSLNAIGQIGVVLSKLIAFPLKNKHSSGKMSPINSVACLLIKFTSRWMIKLLRLVWHCSTCGEDVGDWCGCMTFSKPVSSLGNITRCCRSCGWITAGSSDTSGWIRISLTTCCKKWGRKLRGRTPTIGALLMWLNTSEFGVEISFCNFIRLEIGSIGCYMAIYQ